MISVKYSANRKEPNISHFLFNFTIKFLVNKYSFSNSKPSIVLNQEQTWIRQ